MGFRRDGGILMGLPGLYPMEEKEFPKLRREMGRGILGRKKQSSILYQLIFMSKNIPHFYGC